MTTVEAIAPRAPRARSRSRVEASDLILGLVALTLLALLARLLVRHNFWYDEAMLMANIAEGTWGEMFAALPFYDQAAPQLYLLLLKGLHALVGLDEIAMRLPSWLAGVASIWIVARKLPGLTTLERACAAAVLAGGYSFAYLTMEAKQYQFEILCSCALMAFYQGSASGMRVAMARLGVLLAALASASMFPLAVFAVGAVDQLRGVRRFGDLQSVVLPRVLAGGWIYAAAGLCYVIYYAIHIQPAYQAILTNFGYTYEGFGFVRTGSYSIWLAAKVWEVLESHHAILAAPVLAALVLGLFHLRGRGTAYPAQAGAIIAVMVALNAAGLLPLLPARFSVFVMPWVAVLAGAGIAAVLARITDRGIQMIAATAATAVILLPALHCIVTPSSQDARRSIAYLRDARSSPAHSPIMVTVSGQPVFDVYVKPPTAPGADRCLAAGVLGYTNRCRALKAAGDGDRFAGAATKWYLLNYVAIIGRGLDPVGFPGASPRAFADSYLDWLAGQLPIGKPVVIFNAPHAPQDTDADPLQSRLKASASVARLIDDRLETSSIRAGRIDRVVRQR